MKSPREALGWSKVGNGLLLIIMTWLWSGCTTSTALLASLVADQRERREQQQATALADNAKRSGSAVVLSIEPSTAATTPSPAAHPETISIEKSASFDDLKLAALQRMGIQSTTFVTKEAVDYEDAGRRHWPSGHTNFQNDYCRRIKINFDTLIFSTKELPPVPNRSHWGVVWLAKLASLPVQMMIPVSAIVAAPLAPGAAMWGLEALANCAG